MKINIFSVFIRRERQPDHDFGCERRLHGSELVGSEPGPQDGEGVDQRGVLVRAGPGAGAAGGHAGCRVRTDGVSGFALRAHGHHPEFRERHYPPHVLRARRGRDGGHQDVVEGRDRGL